MDRLGWVEQSPHYVSFIDQSVEAAARLVVADRLIAPFELSKQSKLIIGQLHHQSLRWLRPKVAHLSTAGDCCAAGFQSLAFAFRTDLGEFASISPVQAARLSCGAVVYIAHDGVSLPWSRSLWRRFLSSARAEGSALRR